MHEHKCPACGKKYKTRRAHQVYCSHLCAGRKLIVREWRTCPTCQKRFECGSREKRWTVYCSRRCSGLRDSDRCRPLTAGQAGYLAGLVDGEGSIIALKRRDGSVKSYRLQVTNTCIPVLQWCLHVTGIGTLQSKSTQHNALPHYLPCGTWMAYGVKAASVIRRILPYLIIKREKAKALLEVVKP